MRRLRAGDFSSADVTQGQRTFKQSLAPSSGIFSPRTIDRFHPVSFPVSLCPNSGRRILSHSSSSAESRGERRQHEFFHRSCLRRFRLWNHVSNRWPLLSDTKFSDSVHQSYSKVAVVEHPGAKSLFERSRICSVGCWIH